MQKVLPPSTILIPDSAERVFKGAIFDVYQWPQKLFDGRTATFEMLRRPDTVQILLVRDGQILLVNDDQPGRGARLHVPGGRADEEDLSWLAAGQRELREETGVICKNWRLVEVSQPLIKIEWFTPLFLASDITEELPQQLDPGGEKIELQWKRFDEVRTLVLSGAEPTLTYLVTLFSQVETLEELMALPDFEGKAVDR
jgi:ADP-ribose pyrophosphatase